MNAQTELTQLIQALAKQDWEAVDSLLETLRQKEWAGATQIIGAAFVLAVHRRFRRGQDQRDIAAFVAETRSRYESGKDLPPLAMEALIRAALGEVDLMDEINPDNYLPGQIVVLGTILQDENPTQDQLDRFIREVEETAAEHM
ncbi:hypothetical protein AAH979_00595 [Plantactinospora sp. ZYX-F-223]|uniref:hypothetical protein n=1 Tax=Plantactinospora sp. ZYX-F-223 TaxID=3144103 RepID=UPI0031FCE655